jgi:hypothetical protein
MGDGPESTRWGRGGLSCRHDKLYRTQVVRISSNINLYDHRTTFGDALRWV